MAEMSDKSSSLESVKRRLIEVINNTRHPTRLVINISWTMDEIATLSYDIDEVVRPSDDESTI